MDKIFRRPTQLGGTPKKKKNEKNRKRNMIINFRVSPEEKMLIDARIALSGQPRAEFFIESCLYQTILVKGNIRSFTEIKNRMEEIADVIDKNPHLEDMEPEQAEILKTILEIIDKRFGRKVDMAARSYEERLTELQKKQEQLKEQEKALKKRQSEEERKKRTRRLIELGGIVESVLGRPTTDDDKIRFQNFLKKQERNGGFFTKAMNEAAMPKEQAVES